MIKTTCPCGGTFHVDTGASGETARITEWLDRHQECINTSVIKHAIDNRKADMVSINWGPDYQFVADGRLICKKCGFIQPQDGGVPAHDMSCSTLFNNTEKTNA